MVHDGGPQTAPSLLIAQISDLHIGFDGDSPDEGNKLRCERVLAHLGAMRPPPDLIVVSGDLTERGDAPSYRWLATALAGLTMPVHVMMGNHDLRAALLRDMPVTPSEDGFVQSVIELGDRRVVLLDTCEEGRAGGGFCKRRAAWLTAQLAAAGDTPTLVFLHHPPFACGIDWMDPPTDAAWITRLRAVIANAPQVVATAAGHLHRTLTATFAQRPCIVAPSVAAPLALDLRPTDVVPADGRALIVDGPPGYLLHRWTTDGLVTHEVGVSEPIVLASFEQADRGWVDALRAENRSRDVINHSESER